MSPVLRAWAIAVFWTALIAFESFGGSSENTGRLLRPLLEFLFGPLQPTTFELIHHSLRKAGHFCGYAVLSFTMYRAWWTTLGWRTHRQHLSWRAMFAAWNSRAAVLALLATLAVAGLDEWHQSFQANRGGSVRDVALDECGGSLAQIVMLVARKPRVPSGETPAKETATISS